MAGHSKWANIRFRKGVQDAKRGKVFTKLIREITVAARTGGAEEEANARLRDAVSKALKANMKRDTIDHAIKRGVGDQSSDAMQVMHYEGYAPGGVAILVDCLSDNKNRTVSDVRHAFTKYGGNLGTDGSVSYLFQQRGEILLAAEVPEDAAMELAIEQGADDVMVEEKQVLILTQPAVYHTLLKALEQANMSIEHAELAMHASISVPLDEEAAQSVIKLIDALEDLDDVQAVHTNAHFPEHMLEST
ncbi:MAG: YebC/PmpR family DNA-binding transcriptional regulator [Gammaproteobacteria bacterium]|nr:YebC/PmpR family DNA-binding transcriptional regulator [Gammaproteobacteria bacterium]